MHKERSTLRFRTPLLILMSAAFLSILTRLVYCVINLVQGSALYLEMLSSPLTQVNGISFFYSTAVSPLLGLASFLLLLLYMCFLYRKHWSKGIVVAAYALLAADYLAELVLYLVNPGSSIFSLATVPLLLHCIVFLFATLSVCFGMKEKISLVISPAIVLLSGLYAFFFVSLPGIPAMMEAGGTWPMLIGGWFIFLCSLCHPIALILFGLTHTFPEAE